MEPEMPRTKRVIQIAALATGVIGAAVASTSDTAFGQQARRIAHRLARDARYAAASMPGLVYRLSGRHPDPEVSDDILVDRIRSSIGPVEKRLDLPHIHVMVDDHVAIIHGEVGGDDDVRTLEHAIMNVSGVRGVESHLHVGLVPGDTRPSEGNASNE
jgi:hypothetical protein